MPGWGQGRPGFARPGGAARMSAMSNFPESPYSDSTRPVRRLTLSATDKKIAGVCGGIAEYFGIDPTLVRVITVVFALLFGGGLLAYLLAWIIMPKA